jgi:hypothetical protein
MGPELFERAESSPDDLLPPVRSSQRRTTSIALRMDDDLLARLRAESRKRRIGCQTLLKEIVARGLDQVARQETSDESIRQYENGGTWEDGDETVEVEVSRPLDKVIPVRLACGQVGDTARRSEGTRDRADDARTHVAA